MGKGVSVSINIKEIENNITKKLESDPQFKKRKKKIMEDAFLGVNNLGSDVEAKNLITYDEVGAYAMEFERMVSRYAGIDFSESASSIVDLYNSLSIGDSGFMDAGDNGIHLYIDFHMSGDLTRPSLYPAISDGVYNIVRLMAMGWSPKDAGNPAAGYIFGEWHGRMAHARLERSPINPIEEAKFDWERMYQPKIEQMGGDIYIVNRVTETGWY